MSTIIRNWVTQIPDFEVVSIHFNYIKTVPLNKEFNIKIKKKKQKFSIFISYLQNAIQHEFRELNINRIDHNNEQKEKKTIKDMAQILVDILLSSFTFNFSTYIDDTPTIHFKPSHSPFCLLFLIPHFISLSP